MATYFFETITASQALSYNAATDQLVFTNGTSSGCKTSVVFTPGTATTVPTITITDLVTGRAVVFGPGIQDDGQVSSGSIVFPDGSQLYVGSLAGDAPAPGTTFGDGFFGNSGDDTLNGGGGGDVLQGNQGADSLNGGTANATSNGGNDTIFGGQGNDFIDVGGGSNFAQGNLGDDSITAAHGNAADSGSNNTLLGGQGNDFITGGTGTDTLSGDLGNDTLQGGGGSDSLNGQAGDDSITGSNGADTIDSGAGNDTIHAGGGADILTGGSGTVLFTFSPSDSTAQQGQFDKISGWHLGDRISFSLGGSGPNNFDMVASPAIDFNDAVAKANAIIGGGTFVAVPLGSDLVIFADIDHDGRITASDSAVVLVGKSLADIDLFTIM